MNKMLRVTILGTAVLLTGCATHAPVTDLAPVMNIDSRSQTLPAEPQVPTHDVQARLLAHHATWRGTPHAWGGLTRKGVDCSGYIWHTYRDLFAQTLPRTTRDQAQAGRRVPRTQLREGDLVFFKTGPNKRHAGIYVGNGRFAHASYSKGVTISTLDNVYWKRHYWQSRRLLKLAPTSANGTS